MTMKIKRSDGKEEEYECDYNNNNIAQSVAGEVHAMAMGTKTKQNANSNANANENANTSQAARQNKGIKAKLARQTAKGAAELMMTERTRECEC